MIFILVEIGDWRRGGLFIIYCFGLDYYFLLKDILIGFFLLRSSDDNNFLILIYEDFFFNIDNFIRVICRMDDESEDEIDL